MEELFRDGMQNLLSQRVETFSLAFFVHAVNIHSFSPNQANSTARSLLLILVGAHKINRGRVVVEFDHLIAQKRERERHFN